ncbi:MAG: hypothetical protein ACE5GX_06295 [Thermoanaerobaculia bacterium]
MRPSLEQRILEFIRDAEAADFEQLALELFADQYERLDDYRSVCRAVGVAPSSIRDWREIPVGSAAPGEADSWLRSVAALAVPELFRNGSSSLILSTERDAAPLLSVLAESVGEGGFTASGRLDGHAVRSWLATRQRDRRPVRIAASDSGLDGLLEFLDRRSLKFRLPPGSGCYRVGPAETVGGADWSSALAEFLGLSPDGCRCLVCEPVVTPLLEAAPPATGFSLPHWVRPVGRGPGDVTLVDLAALRQPLHFGLPATAGIDAAGRLVLGRS